MTDLSFNKIQEDPVTIQISGRKPSNTIKDRILIELLGRLLPCLNTKSWTIIQPSVPATTMSPRGRVDEREERLTAQTTKDE